MQLNSLATLLRKIDMELLRNLQITATVTGV